MMVPAAANCLHATIERITRCVDCGIIGPDLDPAVFADGPALGVGSDGDPHDDPYCAAIAPLGSHEARYGEFCNLCGNRRRAVKESP